MDDWLAPSRLQIDDLRSMLGYSLSPLRRDTTGTGEEMLSSEETFEEADGLLFIPPSFWPDFEVPLDIPVRHFGKTPETIRREADIAATTHRAAEQWEKCVIQELSKEFAGNTEYRPPKPTFYKVRFQDWNAGQISASARCLGLKPKSEGADFLKAAKSSVTVMQSGTDMDQTQEIGNSESDNDGLSDSDGLSDGSSATHEFCSNEEIDPRSAGRKRKTADEDDLINRIALTTYQQFEKAFNSTFLPLVSVLQRREEDEQKHREQMLALEEAKLALKRKKFLFKRRRVQALSQPNPRASSSFRSGHKKHGHAIRMNRSAHREPDPTRASVF